MFWTQTDNWIQKVWVMPQYVDSHDMNTVDTHSHSLRKVWRMYQCQHAHLEWTGVPSRQTPPAGPPQTFPGSSLSVRRERWGKGREDRGQTQGWVETFPPLLDPYSSPHVVCVCEVRLFSHLGRLTRLWFSLFGLFCLQLIEAKFFSRHQTNCAAGLTEAMQG